MASGSAMEQDSLLVGACGDGASVLLPFVYFALGVEQQIKRQAMAGVLTPQLTQHPDALVFDFPLGMGVRRDQAQARPGLVLPNVHLERLLPQYSRPDPLPADTNHSGCSGAIPTTRSVSEGVRSAVAEARMANEARLESRIVHPREMGGEQTKAPRACSNGFRLEEPTTRTASVPM